ncbi:MAG: MFS transporter [Pseudomonadales bacterium]|nr:MFS transporter [Pseudomonadales bacterium]
MGERREGVIFAARSFANKATTSAGLVFGGMLIDFIEFPRGAALGTVPADTVWQLGLIAGPATSIFTMLGLVLYLRYRIDRRRHEEIMRELAARQGRD